MLVLAGMPATQSFDGAAGDLALCRSAKREELTTVITILKIRSHQTLYADRKETDHHDFLLNISSRPHHRTTAAPYTPINRLRAHISISMHNTVEHLLSTYPCIEYIHAVGQRENRAQVSRTRLRHTFTYAYQHSRVKINAYIYSVQLHVPISFKHGYICTNKPRAYLPIRHVIWL